MKDVIERLCLLCEVIGSRHASYVGTLTLEHKRQVGIWARKSTACWEHARRVTTWVRKHLRHWTREHLRHSIQQTKLDNLTLSWRRPLSYRNQSIDLLRKSMDWFLYDNDLRHERVNRFCGWHLLLIITYILDEVKLVKLTKQNWRCNICLYSFRIILEVFLRTEILNDANWFSKDKQIPPLFSRNNV